MLTKEAKTAYLAMFSAGPLNKGKYPMTQEEEDRAWDTRRKEFLTKVSQEVIEMMIREREEEELSTTLIEEIKESPMNIQILEKWE